MINAKNLFVKINNKKKRLFSLLFNYLFYKYNKQLNIFFMFIPIDKRKIVFSNFDGGGYGCNPKYIAEELLKTDNKYKLFWIIDKNKVSDISLFPRQIKVVEKYSFISFFHLASAKFWVDNYRKDFFPNKRKKQYYLQTWHGSIALKKIENDAIDKLSNSYINMAKKDSKLIDFCISSGRFMTNIYKESFWYSGAVLEYGSPRNDILINRKNWKQIRDRLFLSDDIKIVMYAPTFRDKYSLDNYQIDFYGVIAALQNKYGGRWLFLIRLHPHCWLQGSGIIIPDFVRNVSNYYDVQELLGITDVLISDYSSLMFDFMFVKRPVFIFATDYEEYKVERGVYFNLSDTPFPIAENNKQLVDNIEQFDIELHKEKINTFISKFGCFENGNASKMVVKKIIEIGKYGL
jgi:CDP-glycerol glycerophosphotransferase